MNYLCIPEEDIIINMDSVRYVRCWNNGYRENLIIKSSAASGGEVELNLKDPEAVRRRIQEFAMHSIREDQ